MLIELHIHQNAVDRYFVELDTTFIGARKFNASNFLDAFQGAFERYLDVLPAEKLAQQGIKDKDDARRAMAEFVWRAQNGSLDPGSTHGPGGYGAPKPLDNLAKARAAKAAKRAALEALDSALAKADMVEDHGQ